MAATREQSCLKLTFVSLSIIAERLSAKQLIVQCGLKSQLAYIYMCATSVTLRNAIKSLVTFRIRVVTTAVTKRLRPRGHPGGRGQALRLRSLYVLLLCRYVPYTCCYYSCNQTLPAPGAPRGASGCSRWRPDELHGCRLCTSDARRNSDLDKSITSFYTGRLTTAPTRLQFV